MRVWILPDDVLKNALQEVHNGEDPGMVLLQIDANVDHEDIDAPKGWRMPVLWILGRIYNAIRRSGS